MSSVMDHEAAEKTSAVERYLLGEFGPEDQAAFEAHFFDCPACAEEVRTGVIFFENGKSLVIEEALKEESLKEATLRDETRSEKAAREAPRDWLAWFRPGGVRPGGFRPATLIPSFAALALLVVAGYQNLVTLPALRQPQMLSAVVIAPMARDAGPVVHVDRSHPLFNVNFAVDSPRVYPDYVCTFTWQDGGTTVLDLHSGTRDVSSFTLGVLLPGSKFPDGKYALTIRPAANPSVVVERYNFTVQSGGSE